MQYKNILITGAANGIGRDLAIQLSKQKTNLTLIDYDTSGNLEFVSNLCKSNGANVQSAILDVRDFEGVRFYLNQSLTENLKVDLILACAGYLQSKEKLHEDFDIGAISIDTNYFGVVNTFELFTKKYNSKNGEAIKLVSITSISKLLTTPNSGFYSASKAALAAYLDGLRLQSRNSNIQVHEIILGFVRTNMTRDIPHAWNLGIESEKAARLILKVINRKIIRVHSIPRTRNLPWLILNLIPRCLTDFFVGNISRLIKK
jgi:short-subunit dehydrogenase